jgi:hypothetical protein
MPLTEDQHLELQEDLMRADLKLKERQHLWETPKGIAAIVAALAVTIGAIGGVVGGVIGYQIGARPTPTINVHLDGPLIAPAQKP